MTNTVQVIPVVLASDGTALKPGLEYDQRQKAVVGLTHKVDASYVKQHPFPDPEEIKCYNASSFSLSPQGCLCRRYLFNYGR